MRIQHKGDTGIKLAAMVVLLLVAPFMATAQKFDGGMMLHSGFLKAQLPEIGSDVTGVPWGMGGVARWHAVKGLRVGGEGYVSTVSKPNFESLSYNTDGSFTRVGWGGLVLDYYWSVGRWFPFAGIGVGGGGSTILLVGNGDTDDWKAEPLTMLHKRAFGYIDPYIGCEMALKPSIHILVKVDWQLPFGPNEIAAGPRGYVGVIFIH